uniref:tRNA (32-2'-O)-methyltransferase regulator THADA n=1 Tax=Plectus sambesii TaxID=2011161 RepID=A0A914XKL9_9BILA
VIGKTDFRLITLFLSTNATEQHPASRHKILTGVKKIFIRIRESAELVVRNDNKPAWIDDYISFLKWILELGFDCLREGANMSRRSTGLGILQLMFLDDHLRDETKSSFFRFANPVSWVKNEHISALIAILDDPFETCQRTALNILRCFPRDALSFLDLDNILSVAFEQLLSLKTRTVYGAAYRLKFYLCAQPPEKSSERAIGICRQLISRVSERIEFVSSALLSIAESHSVYGLLHGVGAVLQSETFDDQSCLTEWHELVGGVLLPACGRVAEVVAPVVHSASPEGFIPPDLLYTLAAHDELTAARIHSRTCQALLVSCWRSLKEMSSIFEQLVRAPYPSVIDQKALEWMSSYYWLQLTECKHFGAFGTAVDGFTRLCERLWSLPRDALEGQLGSLPDPQRWLDDLVSSLESGKESTKLCTTRRSAGLPHLVCAILATEPKSREARSLDETLSRLLVVADSWRHLDTTLCVHAMNVLRVVFRDARMAEAAGAWAEPGLRTAIGAFAADSWSVRNAGSQLLTALLIRIFGVPQTNDKSLPTVSSARVNCLSAFEFFRRYPSMLEFLLSTLTTREKQSSSGCLNDEFALFPAVIILARLYPSLEGPTSLAPFVPHLLRVAFTSRIEKLRVLSTAALAAICEPDDWLLLVRSLQSILIAENGTTVGQNTVNGALLLLHSVVSQGNSSNLSVHYEAVIDIVKKLKKSTSWLTWCEYNKALLAEILAFTAVDDKVPLKMVEFAKGSLVAPLGRLLADNLLTSTSACWKQWHALDARLKRAVIASMAKCTPTENERHILPVVVDELIVCQDEFTLRK